MAQYVSIQNLVKRQHGITVQSCWIAHVKELNGLPMRPSRRTGPRKKPCPDQWIGPIEQAMRELGIL